MITSYPTRTISTHCTHPGCEARLHCFEEWAIGLCALHADLETSPLPAAPEPDWHAILERIDASDPRPDGRRMHRDE